MPWINTKRRMPRPPKISFFDGSADSHRSVKDRIRSIFSFGSRQSEDLGLFRHNSCKSSRPPRSSGDTTVINSPPTAVKSPLSDLDRDFLGDLPQVVQHSMCSRDGDTSGNYAIITSRRALRTSQSSPGLTHNLSHRFCQSFGDPTIIHRTDLRSRPSLQEISYSSKCKLRDEDSFQLIPSNGLASQSRSSSCPTSKPQSTSPTIDSSFVSPKLIDSPGMPTRKETFLIIPDPVESPMQKLSTISESTLPNIPSIVTVEATASAKIFFETHFNSVLCGIRPRSIRRRELEEKLQTFDLPLETQKRARKVWLKNETENLRQERMLMTRTNGARAAKHVSIAGYEVVKVLGKGSFGVVRLVKEKMPLKKHENPLPLSLATSVMSRKPSRTDLATTVLKTTAKEALAPLANRKKHRVKTKKEVYAMKVIRKSEMVRNSQEGHLRAERDFLVAAAGSRWIVPLIAAFQDSHNLYLVMDFCIGGDFLGLLIRKNVLNEEVTKWYVAEMILCVEEAHSMQWIHRDVKPDNFLIDADGHLKISDFGLAFDGEWSHNQGYYNHHRHSLMEKLGIDVIGDEQDVEEAEQAAVSSKMGRIAEQVNCRRAEKRLPGSTLEPPLGDSILDWHNREHRRKLARSVVGTSQYMAPEVIRGEMYDGRCDWWSVGIILYECLYGHTPFACENRQDTKLNILRHKTTLNFPQVLGKHELPISFEALDLMMQLLQEKETRLCSRKYSNNDFTRRLVAGLNVRPFTIDKAYKDFRGHFVYNDDAEDLKRHVFFEGIDWANLHSTKPPFIPRVKNWEDTKYFDEDDPISDLSSSSGDDVDDSGNIEALKVLDIAGENAPPLMSSQIEEPRLSGHQQEDQKIVPSNPAILQDQLRDNAEHFYDAAQSTFNPLISPSQVDGQDGLDFYPPMAPLPTPPSSAQKPAAESQTHVHAPSAESPIEMQRKRRKKDKKRPRDKILRDANTGRTAMKLRKQGAFLGYEYRRAKAVDECFSIPEANEIVRGKRRASNLGIRPDEYQERWTDQNPLLSAR